MLLNPYSSANRDLLATIPGTNIIEETLGIAGLVLCEPSNMDRDWTVMSLYAPVPGRALGGIRAKLVDQKGFVTFCNQRDLEVLLEIAQPGGYCVWLDNEYPAPGERDWIGLCVDHEDLLDDLFDREMEARAQLPNGTPLSPGLELERRVHNGIDNDFEETLTLLWDFDPESGMGPDPRRETIEQRWRACGRTLPGERRRLWLKL